MGKILSVAFVVLGVFVAIAAHGQPTPTLCEIQVDSGLPGTPLMGAVAYGPDGRSVVAYMAQLDTGQEIRVRRFAVDGSPMGGPLSVSSTEGIAAAVSDLGVDPLGNYWILWVERFFDETTYIRRLAPDGTFLGPEVEVGLSPGLVRDSPSVAINGSGGALVWASNGLDGDGSAVVTRWMALDGTLGPEQQVNVHTSGDQKRARVASNDSGEFLVVWAGEGPGGPQQVTGRRLAADGSPVGGDVQLGNPGVEGRTPDVVGAGSGFRVVWSEPETPGFFPEVFTREVDAAGVVGSQVLLSDGTNPFDGVWPRIDRFAGGEFVVVWEDFYQASYGPPDTYAAIIANKLDATGTPMGERFRVNPTQFRDPAESWTPRPVVAAAPTGDEFTVVWDGPGALEDRGIFLQRFDGAAVEQPADLAVVLSDNRDPADFQVPFQYANDIFNLTGCGTENATLTQQLPPEIVPTNVFADDLWDCSLQGSVLDCHADILPFGSSVIRVSATLTDSTTMLESTSTVASDAVDPDPSNNQDTETTEVVLCYDLTFGKDGDGVLPRADPASGAPCQGGRRPVGQAIDLYAEPADGGWRLAGWTGTDDDASTSRFNTLTMPAEDREVSVSYVFDDLISWWTFDGVLSDLAGNHPLSFETGPLGTEPGFDNAGFLFDGADYLSTPDAPGLDLGTGDLTFGAWVRTSVGDGVQALLDKRSAGPVRGFHTFLLNGRPGIQLADGATARNFVSPRSIADGALHQVVFSVDRDGADGLRIFIDGALDSSFDPRPVAGPLDNGERLTIGRRSDGLGADAFFTGLLDEVFLIGRALEPGEVTETLGLTGRWRGELNVEDDTTFGNDGSLLNGAGFTPGSCSDVAFLMGQRDAVTIPYDRSLTPLQDRVTWTAWIRVDPDNNNDPRRVIQNGLESTGEGYSLVLTAGSPVFRRHGGGPGYPSGLPNLRDGQWHFLAFSLKGGTGSEVTFYLDDRPPVTVQVPSFVRFFDNTEPFFFGSPGLDGFTGALDEVHYFRRILGPEEIEGIRKTCRPTLFADGFESGNVGAWSVAVP
ncbi:MAG: LamG-like jellyroll fold domain-containing protein [Acidobacteriota bacterium]